MAEKNMPKVLVIILTFLAVTAFYFFITNRSSYKDYYYGSEGSSKLYEIVGYIRKETGYDNFYFLDTDKGDSFCIDRSETPAETAVYLEKQYKKGALTRIRGQIIENRNCLGQPQFFPN